MGCVNSIPTADPPAEVETVEEQQIQLARASAVQLRLSAATTPTVAQLTDVVLSELIRSRRSSVHNTQGLDAVQADEIAVMLAAQATESHSEISMPEQECIVQALRGNVLFSCMETEQLFQLARFMFIEVVEPGQKVIALGDIGDKFYVVRSGRFDVLSARGNTINRLNSGSTFGELGLLYNAKRTATVTADAKTRGSLYALRGRYFRYVAAQQAMSAFDNSLEALKKVTLLQTLTTEQLAVVASAVQPLQFRAGDVIVHKGEPGKVLYMIHAGTVVCTDIGVSNGTASVELHEGDYFGERALLVAEPRAATVSAKTDVRVMALDQATFVSVLGPLQQLINENRLWRAVEAVAVLKNVPPAVKKRLFEAAKVVQYVADQVIVAEGDEDCESFFIVKEGEAKVLQKSPQPPPPRRSMQLLKSSTPAPPPLLEIARLGAGDPFGEMAILKASTRQATVVAVSPIVECFVLNKTELNEILESARAEFSELVSTREQENAEKYVTLAMTIPTLERVKVIGIGSYGLVYIARHTTSGRCVAVKEMWKARLEQSRQVQHVRCEKELLEHIHSPFILKYFTALQDECKVYFITEALLGGELFQRIVSPLGIAQPLAHPAAQFYAACCIQALGYLHVRDMAYRDLKPENILLDAHGYAKLVDFGFAKKVIGRTYTLCGTPEYLAPEIILGVGHGPAVDTWGLGILLYELVIGDSPFSSKEHDRLAICRGILQDKVRFPHGCDPNWKDLVLALLQKHPDQRPSMQVGGLRDIHQHPYFAGLDWDALTQMTLPAPWTPELDDDFDCRYFREVSDGDQFEFESWKDVPPALAWDKF